MPFSEGQTIVHPFHGPVLVEGIIDRKVNGQTIPFLQLRALTVDLDIAVPVHRADEIGLRPVSSPDQVSEYLGLLASTPSSKPLQWSRRIKDFNERLSSGDIKETCRVIREITLAGPKPPASAEGQMLRQARARVTVELSLALQVTEDEAARMIDEAASTGMVAQAA